MELLTYMVNVPCSTLTPPYANQYCIYNNLTDNERYFGIVFWIQFSHGVLQAGYLVFQYVADLDRGKRTIKMTKY